MPRNSSTNWGGEDWDLMDRVVNAQLEVERIKYPGLYHHYHSKQEMWSYCTRQLHGPGLVGKVNTHLHTPNWHFPLTRHSETFPFPYMKFLCLLKFLLEKCPWKSKSLQLLRKKPLRRANVGIETRAMNLQSITYTTTPLRNYWRVMVWFQDI